MRTYNEALALAGTKVPYSFAGGRTRFATWARDGGDVTCSIYGNAVVTFHADGSASLDACSHHTASTVDAIAYALGAAQCGALGRVGGVVHYRGVPLIRPVLVDLTTGDVLDGDPPTALGAAAEYVEHRGELGESPAGEVRRGKRGASIALAGKVIVPQVRWSDDGIREDMSDAQILEILLAGAR